LVETKEADIEGIEIAAVVVGIASVQEQVVVDDAKRMKSTRPREARRRIEVDFLPNEII
jgi:hypothetical protein